MSTEATNSLPTPRPPITIMATCECGNEGAREILVRSASGFRCVALCVECWCREFPERAAVYALARIAPSAGEFHDRPTL